MKKGIKTYIVFLFIIPLGMMQMSAQNNSFGIKDDTYIYYQKCLAAIRDTIVLDMVDTLFRMTVEDQDVRMQNVALSTRLDYFYHKNQKDSIIANVARTKEYAKKTGSDKYYYHAWSRLITFLINERFLRSALAETQRMQKEAFADDNGIALMQTYQMMGRLYHSWGKISESAKYFSKAIQTNIEKNLDKQYLSFMYCTLGNLYTLNLQYDESFYSLAKARENVMKYYDSASVYLAYSNLYCALEDKDNTKLYLDSLEYIGVPISGLRDSYQNIKMKYYELTGDYSKALGVCEQLLKNNPSTYQDNNYYAPHASYLEKLGRHKEANASYKKYFQIQDSLTILRFNQELGEQAVLLGVNEITAEKNQLEIRLKNNWLLLSIVVITALALILFIVMIQLHRIRKLNKKLEKVEAIKAGFFQNLSHEIRTPLNSIMGFSTVISTTSSEEEIREYSTIILENSKKLLKLFTEALEASDIRTSREKELQNINDCCRKAISSVEGECAKGVVIKFNPCESNTDALIDKIGVFNVVQNLLKNAAKFTQKGEIILKTDFLSKKSFIITVTDTGPGIPSNMREKVFEEYYKIDDMKQGAGMGLPLSRLLADSMKGSLKIDSEYNRGCRMIFIFPI